jgi:hypothetical protein
MKTDGGELRYRIFFTPCLVWGGNIENSSGNSYSVFDACFLYKIISHIMVNGADHSSFVKVQFLFHYYLFPGK